HQLKSRVAPPIRQSIKHLTLKQFKMLEKRDAQLLLFMINFLGTNHSARGDALGALSKGGERCGGKGRMSRSKKFVNEHYNSVDD
ncbi:hypothetical protein P7M41_26205, partial [Vibrio parahaemolyticus]|nr:hypothetical protein [Vibrio parahaemolyticus]